ncbi:Uncharacterized protein Fot_11671 [Forsythia ovata]|uniref:U3 small nucleolar RNA-associated protein 10 N-terminal domain-containing protein n=1 Tax=Forsythia ovata TaxID=205694 RepID=A0ABD1WKC2_9LAMI
MAAGASISAQLHALKSLSNVHADSEPLKKPFTRPSLIFDPKAAADIDLDTILNISLSGLEVLIEKEERFRNYSNDLFSYKSKELDRELVGIEDNVGINASISSYLRLLSGYLELSSAVNTLEYLIRRYKVHVYNAEELILCALPYHETHVFVQIVQLINTGNSRWKFLDGVKASGAPPPRHVIVQQCIRDMGVLEAICNYAAPVKKIHPSKVVTGFCTAVVFEVLRLVTIDSDVVKRILPYLNSGLQLGAKGSDQKAGALIIVTLLAQKVALAPNVVKSLTRSIADIVRADANESADLQCVRMSFMSLINFIQDAKMKSKKDSSSYDVLCKIFNGILDLSNGISDLKILFALEHPEVEVRRSVFSCLDVDGIMTEKAAGSKVVPDLFFSDCRLT